MNPFHRLFFVLVLVAMLAMTALAMGSGSFSEATAELVRNPWGRLTLVDAYGAILSAYLFTAAGERSVAQRVVWLVLFLGLGSMAIAAYALLRLPREQHV